MVKREELAQLASLSDHVREPRMASGCGHNVHVENPTWFAALIKDAAQLA